MLLDRPFIQRHSCYSASIPPGCSPLQGWRAATLITALLQQSAGWPKRYLCPERFIGASKLGKPLEAPAAYWDRRAFRGTPGPEQALRRLLARQTAGLPNANPAKKKGLKTRGDSCSKMVNPVSDKSRPVRYCARRRRRIWTPGSASTGSWGTVICGCSRRCWTTRSFRQGGTWRSRYGQDLPAQLSTKTGTTPNVPPSCSETSCTLFAATSAK